MFHGFLYFSRVLCAISIEIHRNHFVIRIDERKKIDVEVAERLPETQANVQRCRFVHEGLVRRTMQVAASTFGRHSGNDPLLLSATMISRAKEAVLKSRGFCHRHRI
jgi:hypothetical protein